MQPMSLLGSARQLRGLGFSCTIALALIGCKTVTPDLNDKSRPTIEIKVRDADSQYVDASKVDLKVQDSLDISCVVSDAGGVSLVALEFLGKADQCKVGSVNHSGAFFIQPLPSWISQPLSVNSEGKVPERMPLFSTLKGPFECTVPSVGKGVPYGESITVTCKGQNWASDEQYKTAEKVLDVVLK